MKVVFDTNVLFAAFVSHGVCAGIYEECLLSAEIAVSEYILDELRGCLVAKGRFTKAEAEAVVAALRKDAQLTEAKPLAKGVCRDAQDDWVLATAVAAQPDAIVTGDRNLLVLQEYHGVRVVSPRDFLAMLRQER